MEAVAQPRNRVPLALRLKVKAADHPRKSVDRLWISTYSNRKSVIVQYGIKV